MSNEGSARRERLAKSILPNLDRRPFYNGEYQPPKAGARFETFDSFTGAALAELSICDQADVNLAVESAHRAFTQTAWKDDPALRQECLRKLAKAIRANHDDLALLESADVGKPIAGTSAWDISNAADVYDYYAARVLGGGNRSLGTAIHLRREPVGVAVAIVPWNFPFPCISWKIAPALAAGCTVVIKSSERAPLSAQTLGRLVSEAGFPSGVVNVLSGDGAVTGEILTRDPRVRAISFTGSRETANRILQSAAHLPRITLELGGKGANVVWNDADIDAAVTGTVSATLDVAGQNCCAGSRTILHHSIADKFTEQLLDAFAERALGDPLDDATQQGPQIDDKQVVRIDDYVKGAIEKGARCLVGGEIAPAGARFYLPTLLDGVDPASKIAQEEVFGPVGTLFRVSSLREAIDLANGTSYGLSASIWSHDREVQSTFVEEVEVGVCWVNSFGLFEVGAPWGGRKQSGYGRELSPDSLDEFTDSKTVYVADA